MKRACLGCPTWTSSAPACWASTNTDSGPCATSRTPPRRPGHGSNRGSRPSLTGHRPGPGHRGRPGPQGVGDWLFARPLEWRLAVQVAAIDPSAAFRKSAADVASAHRCLGRSLPPGLTGQPGNDRDPAEPVPAGQGPVREGPRQGLAAPHAAPARRQNTEYKSGMSTGRSVHR